MFDYKKIDEYTKFMLDHGVHFINFSDDWELVINKKFIDYDLYNSELGEHVSSHINYEDFKFKVEKHFKEVL